MSMRSLGLGRDLDNSAWARYGKRIYNHRCGWLRHRLYPLWALFEREDDAICRWDA